ncbi:MAG: sugar phosphate isomerase/epimerase [Phycisphaerae bacterium]|nr:sugar phosphate isomerase/epimerase [Phycisphaerae bacterium]
MRADRVGVDLDDLRLPLKTAMAAASELDLRSVEFATVRGELAPRNLSSSGRRHLAKLARDVGLSIEALTADLPGLRFHDPETVDERITRTCEVIELAAEMRVPVVTAVVGSLGKGESPGAEAMVLQALQQVGGVADARGVTFAIRPARDGADEVATLLKRLGCPSVRVGLDPAALVMHGMNPLKIIEWAARDIALLHARDATAGRVDRPGHESPLGEGEVDLAGVMACLAAADYGGPMIIRRTQSANPRNDIARASAIVRGLLPSGA